MGLQTEKDRLLDKVQTVEGAVSLCEDLAERLGGLALLAGDEDGATAVELYRTALKTLLRSVKEHL